MERQPIISSNIASIGYDTTTRTLEIEFKKGKVYQYTPVTQEGYESLMASDSKGKYFIANIKGNDTISFKEVTNGR